jgi:hypothetical protein
MKHTIKRCLGVSAALTTVMLPLSQGALASSYARDMFYQQINNVSSAPSMNAPAHHAAAVHTGSVAHTANASAAGLSYWIELKHGGRTQQVDGRHHFRGGDAIRFHIVSSIDGYAHIVLLEGSSGKSDVLFPLPGIDKTNRVARGKEYVIPSYGTGALKFDNQPGREHLRIALTRQDVDPGKFLSPQGASQVAMAQISNNPAVDPTGGHSQIQISMPEDIPPPKPVTVQQKVPVAAPTNTTAIANAIPDENDGKSLGGDDMGKDMFRDSAPSASVHHAVHHAVHHTHPATHYVIQSHTYTPPPPPPSTVVLNTNANEDLYADITLEHE